MELKENNANSKTKKYEVEKQKCILLLANGNWQHCALQSYRLHMSKSKLLCKS